MYWKSIINLFLIYILTLAQNLEVVFERIDVRYLNDKYLVWGNASVKRYGRKSGYYLNIEAQLRHTWGNNVSLHLLFNEFLHNEYKRTFVEMHYKLCDLINKEPYIGTMIATQGIRCPALPNTYSLMNMTVPSQTFPNVWPFEKARIDLELSITETGESVATAYVYALFKAIKKTKKG